MEVTQLKELNLKNCQKKQLIKGVQLKKTNPVTNTIDSTTLYDFVVCKKKVGWKNSFNPQF